jgi:molecular chaperone HtpG
MKKTNQFKAEIAEMLDLVVNSLYSKKEIFLRELLSNASDAIDRAKFLSLTDKSLVSDNPEWKIQIAADSAAKTLTISDNGIGMDEEDLENNLGTIASSGTKKFRQMLAEKGGESLPELIGQFGVGFYAAFMVAGKVVVETRRRGGDKSFKWESDLSGEYTISDGDRDFPGTSITLYLRDDQLEYLDWWRVGDLVKKYSDFIAYPITFMKKDIPAEKRSNLARSVRIARKSLLTRWLLFGSDRRRMSSKRSTTSFTSISRTIGKLRLKQFLSLARAR